MQQVAIISFKSIVGVRVRVASASLTLIFSLRTGIVKRLLNITRNKEKKHEKILMLAKSKLNSIETLISQELIDMTCHAMPCHDMPWRNCYNFEGKI